LGGLEALDLNTVNLTKPGWVADKKSAEELKSKLDMVEDLLIAWGQQHPAGHALIHFRGIADDPAATLSQLTIKGVPFWDGTDPVHCTTATYDGLVAVVAATQEELSDSESAEPAKKKA
jgi:hypothetical protein